MTDVKRLNHLFALLVQMKQAADGGEVWERFDVLYHPTEIEKAKLKNLYRYYFEKGGKL